jgi:hypothetical protein
VFLLNMNRIFERFVTRLLSDVLQSRVSGSWLSSAPLDHRRRRPGEWWTLRAGPWLAE